MRRLPLLCFLTVLIATPVAHAGPPVAIAPTPEGSVLAGPVLAGDGAAWVVRTAKVRLGVPGAAVRDVFDAKDKAEFPDVSPSDDGFGLAASDGALVFTAFATRRDADDCDDCTDDQLGSTIEVFGPPAGPLDTVAPVHYLGRFDLSRFAADATTVAAVETVVGSAPALVLHDVKAGSEQRIPLGTTPLTQQTVDASRSTPGRAYRVALSATRVAVLAYTASPAVATMFDRATGKELFHTSLPAGVYDDEVGISPDGTTLDLAWHGSSQKADAALPYSLATATADAPVPKVVAQTPPVPFGEPVVRDGVAAFMIGAGALRRPATQRFDGSTAAPAGFPSEAVTGLDVRGAKLAWATPDCIYEQALPADPASGPPAGVCPRAVTSVMLDGDVTGRKGHRTLPLSLRCVSEPAGCHTRVRIKLGKDHQVADSTYRLRNGQLRIPHVPLISRYDKLSNQLGLAKLRITVTTKDSAGHVAQHTAILG